MECLRQGLGIPGSNGVDELLMDLASAGGIGADRLVLGEVVRGLPDRLVKLKVRGVLRQWIVARGAVGSPGVLHLVHARRVGPDVLNGHAVQDETRFTEVANGIGIKPRDAEAAMSLLLAQALLHESTERLAQGGPAHAEIGREGHLPQPLAGMEFTEDDGATNGVAHFLTAGPRLGGGGHGRIVRQSLTAGEGSSYSHSQVV